MKLSKQILCFSLILAAFCLLECTVSLLLPRGIDTGLLVLDMLFYYLMQTIAAVPPFLALGVAVGAIRTRGFAFALLFVGIYAGIDLFTQVPLSLFAYAVTDSASYGAILFSYMLSSAVFSLALLFALLLGYALFMQHKSQAADRALFSLRDGGARVLALCAAIFTAYRFLSRLLDILSYAKSKLYILSAEDILDFGVSLLFVLLLGVLSFAVGRFAERRLPSDPSSAR